MLGLIVSCSYYFANIDNIINQLNKICKYFVIRDHF